MRFESWIEGALGATTLAVLLVFAAPSTAHEREGDEQRGGYAACVPGEPTPGSRHLEYPVGAHAHVEGHRIYHARGRYVYPYPQQPSYGTGSWGWGYAPHVIIDAGAGGPWPAGPRR